jgi:trehalose-6-phosphate synthase
MRMHRMRELIREHNIYQWAGNLITELCEIRLNAEDGEGKFRVHASAV